MSTEPTLIPQQFNASLEQSAQACQQHRRYKFLLAMGPLRLRNVTGCPVNPIAVF